MKLRAQRAAASIWSCGSCPAEMVFGIASGKFTGAFAEDKQIGQRIAAQAIGTVQTACHFPGGEQSRHGGTSASRHPPALRP
jgi:hypothetical protein